MQKLNSITNFFLSLCVLFGERHFLRMFKQKMISKTKKNSFFVFNINNEMFCLRYGLKGLYIRKLFKQQMMQRKIKVA